MRVATEKAETFLHQERGMCTALGDALRSCPLPSAHMSLCSDLPGAMHQSCSACLQGMRRLLSIHSVCTFCRSCQTPSKTKKSASGWLVVVMLCTA